MKDTELDAMLKEMLNPQKEYTADNGFTDQILHKLPATAPRLWSRYLILTAFTAAAIGIVLLITPGFSIVTNAVIETATAIATFRLPSLVSLVVVGLFVWGALIPVYAASRR